MENTEELSDQVLPNGLRRIIDVDHGIVLFIGQPLHNDRKDYVALFHVLMLRRTDNGMPGNANCLDLVMN